MLRKRIHCDQAHSVALSDCGGWEIMAVAFHRHREVCTRVFCTHSSTYWTKFDLLKNEMVVFVGVLCKINRRKTHFIDRFQLYPGPNWELRGFSWESQKVDSRKAVAIRLFRKQTRRHWCTSTMKINVNWLAGWTPGALVPPCHAKCRRKLRCRG